MNLIVLVLLTFLAFAAPALAQQGEVGRLLLQNGQVFLLRPLTRSGSESDAVLAPGGKAAYFVRSATDTEPPDRFDCAANEIMAVDTTGAAPRVLLTFKGSDEPERNLRGFGGLTLSPDGRTLYFNTTAWATSGALHALDLVTGKERFITSSNGFFVATRQPYAGNLVVVKHKYHPTSGSYDHWWLVTPDGKEIRDVAPDERTAERLFR